MTEQLTIDADRELKQRHRAMWALGDYPGLADDLVTPLGRTLVEACAIRPGERVLDVAAGSGNVAVPAARIGADVTATDLTPELLAAGRDRAPDLPIQWRQADAEALPFTDNSFDVVTSCIGAMFAPHHQQTADELVRVCRSGGRIGLLNWTPEGFVGRLFAAMKPFAPAPPPGVQPAPLWGNEDHVRELVGDRVTDLRFRRQTLRVDRFRGSSDFREYFKSHYGPTIVAYRGIADDPERTAELDAALDGLAASFDDPAGGMDWEYVVVTMVKP